MSIMQIIKDYPPNIDKIRAKFQLISGVIFAYGDILYNPDGEEIKDHLLIHEETHMRQQGNDPESWWDRYIEDGAFRLSQEVEAYKNQYKFFRRNSTRSKTSDLLNRIASDLSSPLYGNIIEFKEAKEAIRK